MTDPATATPAHANGASKSRKAFDAPHTSLFVFDPDDLVVIGVDTRDTEAHALYDARAMKPISDEFVDNVIMLGVMENIRVTKSETGKAVVVYGRRRTLAARKANEIIRKSGKSDAFIAKYGGPRELIRIKADVAPRGTSDAELALQAGSENAIRLEENLLEKAARVHKILGLLPAKMPEPDKYRQVAVHFGVSETAIRQWLKVVEAAAVVRRAVADGTISATAAVKIAAAGTPAEQTEALEKLLAGEGKPTAAKAERAAGKTKRAKKVKDGEAAPKGPGRSKRAIKKVLAAISDNRLRMPREHKEVADMVLLWALGDDLDGETWGDVQDDPLLRTLTGREKPAEKSE